MILLNVSFILILLGFLTNVIAVFCTQEAIVVLESDLKQVIAEQIEIIAKWQEKLDNYKIVADLKLAIDLISTSGKMGIEKLEKSFRLSVNDGLKGALQKCSSEMKAITEKADRLKIKINHLNMLSFGKNKRIGEQFERLWAKCKSDSEQMSNDLEKLREQLEIAVAKANVKGNNDASSSSSSSKNNTINNAACPEQLLACLNNEDFKQQEFKNAIADAKLKLILAIGAVAELLATAGSIKVASGNDAEGIINNAKQLIKDIELGFGQKQSEHFYASIADRVYETLTAVMGTPLVSMDGFQQKILEIAARLPGKNGQVIAKQLADKHAKGEWIVDDKWSQLDLDAEKRLLVFQFLYIHRIVSYLDENGWRRAEHLSCDPEVLKWNNINRFGVFMADLFATRVLAKYEALMVPKLIVIDALEFTKFAIRISLAPSLRKLQQPEAERWHKNVSFEFGMENRGVSVRIARMYALLDGTTLDHHPMEGLQQVEQIIANNVQLQFVEGKCLPNGISYKDVSNAIRTEMDEWKLEIIGGENGHRAHQLMEAILQRTKLEMESKLVTNAKSALFGNSSHKKVLKEETSRTNKGKHLEGKMEEGSGEPIMEILCFYMRYYHNLSKVLMLLSRDEYDRDIMVLNDWLKEFTGKIFATMLGMFPNSRIAGKVNEKKALEEILINQSSPLYRLANKKDLSADDDEVEWDEEEYLELKKPSEQEKSWLKTVFANAAEKSPDSLNEERAKFGIRAGLRPFIYKTHELDFECGPIISLANCLAFMTNNKYVDFVHIFANVIWSSTKKGDFNYTLRYIENEFAQWADVEPIGIVLKKELTDGIEALLKDYTNKFQQAVQRPSNLYKLEALVVFSCYFQRVARLLTSSSNSNAFRRKIEHEIVDKALLEQILNSLVNSDKMEEMQQWMMAICY